MLTRGRILDLWCDAHGRPRGMEAGIPVETIVAFARMVEAAALRNAVKDPGAYRCHDSWGVEVVGYDQIMARARQAERAARS